MTIDHVGEIELSAKDAALLAVLAFDGACARSRLAAWLWPRTAAQQARGNLRQRLLRLRRMAGVVVADGSTSLTLSPHVATEFEDELQTLRIDPNAGIEDLLGAIEYPDCEELEEWLFQTRQRWRARCLAVMAAAALDHEKAGCHDLALAYVRRLIDEDPLNEHSHRELMRLHRLRGDHSALLQAYARVHRVLKLELGIEPSPQTQAVLGSLPLSHVVP